jgi:hypothetical protein
VQATGPLHTHSPFWQVAEPPLRNPLIQAVGAHIPGLAAGQSLLLPISGQGLSQAPAKRTARPTNRNERRMSDLEKQRPDQLQGATGGPPYRTIRDGRGSPP